MTKVNSVNNPLSSATGTSFFVGSDSAVLTGNIDAGGATTFEIPNSAAPTLNAAGQIALDTTITGYPGLIKYYSGSEEMTCVGMLTSDLVTNDGYCITYNSASSKFNLEAQPSSATGKVVQWVISTSSADDSTTSTSPTATSMTITITPTSTSNKIVVFAYGVADVVANALGPTIEGNFYLRRTSGTANTLDQYKLGRLLALNVASLTNQYYPISLGCEETAPATSAQTYIVQFASEVAQVTTRVFGSTYVAFMFAMEVAP